MGAASVTGTGNGSVDWPVRQLSELRKVITDSNTSAFGIDNNRIVSKGWGGKIYLPDDGGVLVNDGHGNLDWHVVSGTGDMITDVYDPDEDGVVSEADHATTADSATTADHATNWDGLPANASGFLKNDGAGALSWGTPTSLGEVIVQDFEFADGYEKWDDLRIPGTNTRVGTSAPSFEVFRNGVYLLGFVYNQVDEVHFTIQLPHQWKEGSDIFLTSIGLTKL